MEVEIWVSTSAAESSRTCLAGAPSQGVRGVRRSRCHERARADERIPDLPVEDGPVPISAPFRITAPWTIAPCRA
jgi:hypothetical protein